MIVCRKQESWAVVKQWAEGRSLKWPDSSARNGGQKIKSSER